MKRLFALLLCLTLLLIPSAQAEEDALPTYHCNTLYELKCVMADMAQDMESGYILTSSEELFAQLSANDFELLHSIENTSGIVMRSMVFWRNSFKIRYTDIEYYPGFKVVAASRSGQFEKLSIDEMELYELATQIIDTANASTSDTLSLEIYLHDEITRRCSYYTDGYDGLTRKDTALGALVDGLADCDGYSDAFYLLANLAGFNVRLMRGTSNNGENNSSHLWNAIHLNDEWYAVDVTWDDFEDSTYDYSPFYTYLNIGADRLSVTHTWLDDALFDPIAEQTGIANYYNAVGGVCTDWDYAGGYIAWRLEQGQITDTIMLPGYAYDNDALNRAIQSNCSGWSWNCWYKVYGNDLYISYYLHK